MGFGVDGTRPWGSSSVVTTAKRTPFGSRISVRSRSSESNRRAVPSPRSCTPTPTERSNNGLLPQPRGARAHDFQPGRVYYLGDYAGTASFESELEVVYGTIHWSLDDGPDRQCVSELRRDHHRDAGRFQGSPRVADRRREAGATAPRPQLRARRSHPSKPPGSCVSTSAATPAWTNAARRARPENASPSAECPVPIACINRCKGDTDCPTGLACNCAGDERPGCHTIAAQGPAIIWTVSASPPAGP